MAVGPGNEKPSTAIHNRVTLENANRLITPNISHLFEKQFPYSYYAEEMAWVYF